MKKALLLALCLMLCLSCAVGCEKKAPSPILPITGQSDGGQENTGGNPSDGTPTTTLSATSYDLSEQNDSIRFIGRTKVTSDGIICDHSASGIEFSGYMSGAVTLTVSASYDTYYTVFIDGVRKGVRFNAKKNNTTLTLASFGGEKLHTIRILKQTEAAWSQSTFKKLDITGYLTEAPAQRELYVEFLGDSLTSAFGNIGTPTSTPPSGEPKYQDATKSYAFLLAEALNADCSINAMSGVGLAKSGYDNPFLHYYQRYSHKRGNELFDFSTARAPDLMVIHLGANDYTSGCDMYSFIEKAKELIGFVRTSYKNDALPIIWAYDPSEGLPDYIRSALNSLGGEASGLYIIELEWRSIGAGAGGHPGTVAHQRHAELLLELISSKQLLPTAST